MKFKGSKIGLGLIAAMLMLTATTNAHAKLLLGCIYPERVVERINLSADAYFDFDKATLKPAGRAKLDRLANDMSRTQQIYGIQVVGHTDSLGSAGYNQNLSERRAATVRHYLISRGLDGSRIDALGMGEHQPVAPNKHRDGSDNPAGRAQNRRVEIAIEADQQVIF